MDRRDAPVRRHGFLRLSRGVATAVALGCVLGTSGCREDTLYDVGAVQVAPNHAQQDDVVTFLFSLVIVPERNFTVTAIIDDGRVLQTEPAAFELQ